MRIPEAFAYLIDFRQQRLTNNLIVGRKRRFRQRKDEFGQQRVLLAVGTAIVLAAVALYDVRGR
jgi:hypothetical protein